MAPSPDAVGVVCWHCGGSGRVPDSLQRAVLIQRAARIATASATGASLSVIARAEGISRERVRQILAAQGLRSTQRGHGRQHHCDALCQTLLKYEGPIPVAALSRRLGEVRSRVAFRAQMHNLPVLRRSAGHALFCGETCAWILAGLTAGRRPFQIMKDLWGAGTTRAITRYRLYHPEWPWPGRSGRK